MKSGRENRPEVRVVEENEAEERVVLLGADETPVRLGGAAMPEDEAPQRLELVTKPVYQERSEEPTADEILDSSELESSEFVMEKQWGADAKRWMVIPWGWFVLIAAMCGGLALWSLRQIGENQPEVLKETQAKVEGIEMKRQMQMTEARELYGRLETRVTAYLAAETIPELLKHVRDPERVEPLMKEWYATHPLTAVEFRKFRVFRPVTLVQRPFWIINADTTGGLRSLLVEQIDDDGLVDWETDVCYQPMDWDRFVAERPEGEADFRVRAMPDIFYSYEFADESRYRCFRLTTRGSDEHLFGYVLRGSEEERQILRVGGTFQNPVALILRLTFPPDSKTKCSVVIRKVIGRRWCRVGEGK